MFTNRNGNGGPYAGAELPLANGFAYELGREEVYLKVPKELGDEVDALIEERLSKTPALAQK